MLGHDDIVLDRDHGVVTVDGGEQLLLYHLPYGCEHCAGRIRAAIGGIKITHDGTEGLTKGLNHMQGDVVDAWARVVVSGCASGHSVLYGFSWFHDLFRCSCGKTVGHAALSYC